MVPISVVLVSGLEKVLYEKGKIMIDTSRFAYDRYRERMGQSHHLETFCKVEHFEVHLYSQSCPDVCQVIEERAISSFKEARYDITMVLHSLDNEALLPFWVSDHSLCFSRTHPCREVKELVV